jgi:hypothetical protein
MKSTLSRTWRLHSRQLRKIRSILISTTAQPFKRQNGLAARALKSGCAHNRRKERLLKGLGDQSASTDSRRAAKK